MNSSSASNPRTTFTSNKKTRSFGPSHNHPQHVRWSVDHLRNLYSDLLFHISLPDSICRRQREASLGSPRRRLVLLKQQWTAAASSYYSRAVEGNNFSSSNKQGHGFDEDTSVWYDLAATRSTCHQAQQQQPWRRRTADEETAHRRSALFIEHTVVKLIHSIGQVVVRAVEHQQQRGARDPDALSGRQLRCDELFEYFCEKAILTLLVDMVREKPGVTMEGIPKRRFRGVVWTAKVKAEALQTVSRLISCIRDPSSLYFILSQHWINELISSFIPLDQWTDPAMEILVPPYVDLLKNLALVLSDSPHLFCFFNSTTTTKGDYEDDPKNRHCDHTTMKKQSTTNFSLFSATLETGTGSFAESNSFVHATCLNLIVDLMQMQDSAIQRWVREEAQQEQVLLAHHLCDVFLRRHRRMVILTNGPVVDSVRCDTLAGQMQGLNDQIDILNDVFECGIRSLNVRLCELILERVIGRLWRDLVYGDSLTNNDNHHETMSTFPSASSYRQSLLAVGCLDADVIPEREALAQVSLISFAAFFHRLRFGPLVRMIAVALFHPRTTNLWNTDHPQSPNATSQASNSRSSGVPIVYRFTPALHQIAQSDVNGEDSGAWECETQASAYSDNLFRSQVLKALGGEFGEWYVASAAILLELAIQSPSLDVQTLSVIKVLPIGTDRSVTEFGK